MASDKGRGAFEEEWANLRSNKVWREETVKEWLQVSAEARSAQETVHFGYLFGIMVEKNSEPILAQAI